MAKIIYKEGCEGQNKIECIEGIEIELLNGYKALVFPKYKELPLLSKEKIKDWKVPELTEIQALKVVDGKALTDKLFELGSPAAEFVRQFKSNNGEFDLPTLLAAEEIVDQKKDIDVLAETIEEADLLRYNWLLFWSYCRSSSGLIWSAYGNIGLFGDSFLCNELLAVPTKIYK